jgi:AcrR family transcriptional regulator
MMDSVKHPTHRQRQAQATQQLILDTARDLFAAQGYGTTTIDAIAARAGVAVSTVYAIYKNKRGILVAIREAWHQESGLRDIIKQALQEPDGAKRLAMAAHATRRQWETSARMMAIYASAAAVDAEAAAELQVAYAGRRAGMASFIRESMFVLRPDMDEARATAIYLSLTRPEVYQELVEAFGWSPDAYEAWLTDVLQQQLLA